MSISKRISLHVLQAIAYICAYGGTLGAAVAGKHGITADVYFILLGCVLLPIAVFYAILWFWTKGSYGLCFDIIGLCISALAVVILLQLSSFSPNGQDLIFIAPWLMIFAPSLVMVLRHK